MALKFLNSGGYGWTSDAVTAFYYAVENGADVTSNSWGGGSYSETMEDVINYAYSQGVIMVASAGNNDSTNPKYPAYYDHMIAVAATDSDDRKASFSNYGDWVDIAAPGVDVLSLRANGTSMGTVYDYYTTIASGTSMACPHVAGSCALLLSVDPELTVDEATDALKQSADPIEAGICQSGRLNIHEALLKLVRPQGVIRLDREAYSCSGVVGIEVRDSDLKSAGTQDVNVTTDGGDFETVILAEQGTNTGIFGGSMDISADSVVTDDGVLQVSHGQTLTATYEDANDGTGYPKTTADNAIVDCEEAVVLDVNVTTSLTGRTMTIKIQTDEPTKARVRCGLACGGSYELIGKSIVMSTNHTITLLPLTNETDYYFIIELTDAADNETIADNDGACYLFTTPEFLGFLVPSMYPTIQAAVDDTWDGDTVWVADGTYTGDGNRDIDFKGKAITVRSENGPENCIIDCNGTHRGFNFHSEEPNNAVLDGFTIINCSNEGIYIAGWAVGNVSHITQPTINNCIISSCSSNGIKCYDKSYPQITNCTIMNNGGYGISNDWSRPKISDCIITDNGDCGISNDRSLLEISSCTITDNGGCGISNHRGSSEISGCIIANNKGSGISSRSAGLTAVECIINNNHNCGISYNSCSIEVTNCIISGNYTPNNGGGIGSNTWDDGATVIKNCIISGNKAAGRGGGIYSNPDYGYKDIKFINCTIINNTAEDMGGGLCLNGYQEISNCIIWGNTATNGSQIAISTAVCNSIISYSDVRGGPSAVYYYNNKGHFYWGPGNIYTNPRFALPGDYHILSNSPCIDAGTNNPSGGLPVTDMYGSPRSLDGDGNGSAIADMGAYEVEYNSSTPIIAINKEFFEFYNFNGEPNPEDKHLSIRNCAGGTLNWEISDDSFWLEAIPNSGNSTGDIKDITLRVDTTNLSYGEYTCTLTIFDDNAVNSPRTVRVKLHVAANIRVPENHPTIQEAIDASADRSTIIVADGIYTGKGNKNISFRGKAITVRSENGPENCIIDCEDNGRGFIFTEHEENDSVLDGFTLINGNSTGYGGGIYVDSSSPTIINCDVINCSTTSIYGGGIYCRNSNAKIVRCFISENFSERDGGGISCSHGRSVTIDGCTVINNTAIEEGGGINIRNGTHATVSNCLITGNTAGTLGGGFYNYSCFPNLFNCTISDNTAYESGGGVYYRSGVTKIYGCILWGNSPNELHAHNSDLIINYSDVRGGSSDIVLEDGTLNWGDGNIGADPCFVEPGFWDPNGTPGDANDDFWIDGDYHLLEYSPCINAGDPCYVAGPNETDLDGRPRVLFGRIDMGVYEFNHIPIADAGLNTTVYTGLDGTAQITLDGTGSYDDDGQPLTYIWFWSIDGNDYDASGPTPTIQLPVGEHIIELIVNDQIDDSDPDEVTITVVPPIEVQMKFTPKALNPRSKGKWLKAHFVLPEGFTIDDVDAGTPAVIAMLGIESEYMNVFINEDGLVEIEAAFSRSDFCVSLLSDYTTEVTVIGLLTTGQRFYGTDTIRIINNKLEQLAVFSSYWLEADCGKPHWCGGADLNEDSVVNFIDFALLAPCCIEVIK